MQRQLLHVGMEPREKGLDGRSLAGRDQVKVRSCSNPLLCHKDRTLKVAISHDHPPLVCATHVSNQGISLVGAHSELSVQSLLGGAKEQVHRHVQRC